MRASPQHVSWRTAAADLVLGASCPVCGQASRSVCPVCAHRLLPRPRSVHHLALPVVVAGEHREALQATVVAWKELPRPALTPVLAHLLAASVCELAGPARPLALVPVPASRRSRRARGRDVVADLAAAATEVLSPLGVDVRVCPGLRMRRQTSDQSGLGAQARARNVAGAFAAVPVRALREGREVVVVDDVVTTGATVREAARALREIGTGVLGAAVVSGRS